MLDIEANLNLLLKPSLEEGVTTTLASEWLLLLDLSPGLQVSSSSFLRVWNVEFRFEVGVLKEWDSVGTVFCLEKVVQLMKHCWMKIRSRYGSFTFPSHSFFSQILFSAKYAEEKVSIKKCDFFADLQIESGGSSLLLRKGRPVDEGKYTCVATSPAGNASLNVNVELMS